MSATLNPSENTVITNNERTSRNTTWLALALFEIVPSCRVSNADVELTSSHKRFASSSRQQNSQV